MVMIIAEFIGIKAWQKDSDENGEHAKYMIDGMSLTMVNTVPKSRCSIDNQSEVRMS